MSTLHSKSERCNSPVISRLLAELQSGWHPEHHLKGKGGRPPQPDKRGELLALCLFHEEKTPSMSFNPVSGVFHCFGCGEEGGTLDFARRLTGKTGLDALLALADIWHVTLPSELRHEAERALDRRPGLPMVATRPPTLGPTLSTFRADGPTPLGVESVSPSTHAHWEASTTGTAPPEHGPSLSTSGVEEQTPVRDGSVRPSANETWATFEPLSANERVLAYVRRRGLYSDAAETEARATPGQPPRLALALRSLNGKVCDVQFRAVEEVPHDKRFKRLGHVPDGVGPLVFGQLGPVEELVLVEGMSDFLAVLGPFALPHGSVLGLPGATCAQKVAEALVECMPRSLRTVVLAFDNDPAGDKAAEDVTPLLTNAGLSVKRVCPPSPHKDLADWAVALLRTGEDAPAAWRDALTTAPRSRSWLVPSTDFVAEAPGEVRFLIKDVLPVGALALVQGPPGVGKTWLTLHYASLAIEQGKRVILVEQEGSQGALSKRLHLLGTVHPLLDIVHGQPIRMDDPTWVERLARVCRQREVALLILDPLAELHSGDENDTQDMTRLIAALKHIRRAVPDCAILILHHTVKGAWSAVTARREHSRGSSVLVGAADVQISLTQLDPGRAKPAAHFLLELMKARDFQAPPPMKFTLLVQEGHGEVVLQPVEADAEGAEREETEEDLDTRALSQIPTDASGDTISLEALRQRLHVGKEKVQGTVNRLVAAGHVTRVQNRGLRRTGKIMSAQEGNQP